MHGEHGLNWPNLDRFEVKFTIQRSAIQNALKLKEISQKVSHKYTKWKNISNALVFEAFQPEVLV